MKPLAALLLLACSTAQAGIPSQAEKNIVGAVLLLTPMLASIANDHGEDKLAHCIAGAGISFVAWKLTDDWRIGVVAAAAAGGLKENADHQGAGQGDRKDFAATALCGALAPAITKGVLQ